MGKDDATLLPFGDGGVDVGHLEPEGAAVRRDRSGHLLEEDREVVTVLEGDGLTVRDLELHGETEGVDVPAAGAGQVGHGNPQMVEAEHVPTSLRPPRRTSTRGGPEHP